MKQRNIYIILFYLILTACQSEADKQLSYALKLSGDNRPELEKVLEHYKNDSQKLKAAQFLISGMPGQVGYDSALIAKLQLVYDKHSAISDKHNWEKTSLWKIEINDMWRKEDTNINPYQFSTKPDIDIIKSDWLIREIDLTFKAWKENAYTKDMPFDDFCRYILPYRFNDKFCLDNNRQVFYDRHHGLFNDKTKDFRTIADSLHFQYSAISHSKGTATSMPIINIVAYEQIKRGLCEDQTRFNSHLMSALGMAIVTDFSPGWGNRTDGHNWNALITDGKTYPFEPFWDKERWKYNRIYNNETFDLQYGRFRLPKVFRYTFEYYLNGPMIDEKESRENIPGLFLNPRVRDVSKEYFRTTDVMVDLTETIPENTRYCYLCIFEPKRMTWTPTQWGKIEQNKVIFKDMGRDIVYLPVFYQNGTVIPAAPAFILNRNGKCIQLKCNDKIQQIATNTTTPLGPKYERLLNGAQLTGSNNPVGNKQQELLYSLSDTVDIYDNYFKLRPQKEYRYIRLTLAIDTVALNEIAFYERQGDTCVRIPNVKVSADNSTGLPIGVEKIVDQLSGSGYFGAFKTGKGKKNGILFDLGKTYMLDGFSINVLPEKHVCKEEDYTLYYWDNEWKKVEKVKGNDDFISFAQVPANALYLIKSSVTNTDTYYTERIFTYDNRMISWW